MIDREAQCCGHIFQTVAQRRAHEAKVARGQFTQCPCGEVCFDPAEMFVHECAGVCGV